MKSGDRSDIRPVSVDESDSSGDIFLENCQDLPALMVCFSSLSSTFSQRRCTVQIFRQCCSLVSIGTDSPSLHGLIGERNATGILPAALVAMIQDLTSVTTRTRIPIRIAEIPSMSNETVRFFSYRFSRGLPYLDEGFPKRTIYDQGAPGGPFRQQRSPPLV